MESRRSKKQKWTEIPKDFIKQITQALEGTFADETKSGRFIVEGRFYPSEILLRMGYLEKGRIRQANFEMSADYNSGAEAKALLNICVDVGATMLEDYFSTKIEEQDFPRIWQSFEVEKKTIYVQFSGENSDLEKQADKLLNADDDALVKNSGTIADDIKAQLGLTDEDDDDSDDEGNNTKH